MLWFCTVQALSHKDKGYGKTGKGERRYYLHNEEELTARLQHLAGEYLGEENVVKLERRMTAEDFAYFAQRVPSCLYRLGVRNEAKGIESNLHSSTFDIDETALETGTGLMAWFAINLLAKE